MEENNNMTAERSLAIITEQIERSRRAVSKSTGQSLYISGLCTMAMAVIVPIVNLLILPDGYATLGHLLWFTLPFIIVFIIRNLYKNREHAPVSLVGTLVGKTWKTFGVFGLGFFILANGWNYILSNSTNDTMAIVAHHANLTPVIYLLMGMAVAITGHILNSRWLVWFGIIASLHHCESCYCRVRLCLRRHDAPCPLWCASFDCFAFQQHIALCIRLCTCPLRPDAPRSAAQKSEIAYVPAIRPTAALRVATGHHVAAHQ